MLNVAFGASPDVGGSLITKQLIFVVDDVAAISDVVAAALEQGGFEVIAFTSPLQVLAAAGSARPDLLVSDIDMDEMDGLTLASKVQELHPHCKVLMMSGAEHEATAHPPYAEFEFLPKPLALSMLLAKVRAMLRD